jgi:hypothetical protein
LDLQVSVSINAKNVVKQLQDIEQQGERTDESLSGIGEGAERSQKKATGAFGKIARSLKTLRGEARRDINVGVSVDTDGVERARQAVSGRSSVPPISRTG